MKLLIIEAEQVQNGGVPVGYADSVFDRGKAELVRGSMDRSTLHPTASHSEAESVLVVIAPRVTLVFVFRKLGDG